MDEEARLLDEALRGSEEAFCRIVRLHQGRVRTYLSRFARNPDVADDLAQEVFLTAYQSLRTFKGDAPLSLWLIGIARHRALRYLRDEARRKAREGGRFRALVASLQAEAVEAAEAELPRFDRELAALRDCLNALPGESSEIVTQHYFQGRTLVSLAGQLGKKETALRVSLLRIRAALRRCVQGKLSLEGA